MSSDDAIGRSIDHAVAAERERCAKIVEGEVFKEVYRTWPQIGDGDRATDSDIVQHCNALAAAIRANEPQIEGPPKEQRPAPVTQQDIQVWLAYWKFSNTVAVDEIRMFEHVDEARKFCPVMSRGIFSNVTALDIWRALNAMRNAGQIQSA